MAFVYPADRPDMMMSTDPMTAHLENPLISPSEWHLREDVIFLNHGSFGACPKSILAEQRKLQEQMESEPVDFLLRDLEDLLDRNRHALGSFIGAEPEKLVFVPNATTAVNSIVRSLPLARGGNVVSTTHVYNACANALEYAAGFHDLEVRYASLPFPAHSANQWTEALEEKIDSRTKLVLLDHITSSSALVLPVAEMVGMIRSRAPGAIVIIDGAHVPGQIPLDVSAIGADFYTGNLHKWLLTPKSVAFLHIGNPALLKSLRPTVISHGANSARTDRPFHFLEFDWTGTTDPTPALCIEKSISWGELMVTGGWREIMTRNRRLALEARRILAYELDIPLPCPDESIACMATLPLPENMKKFPARPNRLLPGLQEWLRDTRNIEVPTPSLRSEACSWIRISAQAYNTMEDYRKLAAALHECASSNL